MASHGRVRLLTSSLLAAGSSALANGAGLLQVHVPAVLLALCVLDGEAEDGAALLDGVLALGIVLEGVGDQVESGRRGNGFCLCVSDLFSTTSAASHDVPFLRDMMEVMKLELRTFVGK